MQSFWWWACLALYVSVVCVPLFISRIQQLRLVGIAVGLFAVFVIARRLRRHTH